jgi:SAM-dependent methyltransferase
MGYGEVLMTIHEKAAVGFSRVVDAYERGRPEYPLEAVEFLIRNLQINKSSTVLDLGAGTGKFSRLLKPVVSKIIAVEPVESMRLKFNSLLPEIQILNGTAESIPLPDKSVDVVIVAQAFHWFNGPKALQEIYRVLKPSGKIGLIWNVRDESFDWVARLTKIIDPHEGGAPRYKTMNWKKSFDETVHFSKLQLKQFSYVQVGAIETIIDRVGSISFISCLPEKKRNEVLNQVRKLIETHPETTNHPQINLPYRTDVYWCEKL